MKQITRKNKMIRLIFKEGEDNDWPPVYATNFIAWFNEKIVDFIPIEYRSSAKIEIGCFEPEEGILESRICISYIRPANERQRLYELNQLAELKRKYEK